MRWFGWLLTLVVGQAACQEEKLTAHAPRLDVSVYYMDQQAYRGSDPASLTIDLGQIPVYSTKWAVYQLENQTQVPLHISGVVFTHTTGLRWQEAHWLNFEDLAAADRGRPFDSPAAGKVFYDCDMTRTACEVVPPTCDKDEVPALINGCTPDCVQEKNCTVTISPFGTLLLGVAYMPLETGVHGIDAEIYSDASNARIVSLHAQGEAVFNDAPDIAFSYDGYTGPSTDNCTGTSCVIPDEKSFDFGNIGLGSVGSKTLNIYNTARCTPFVGVDPCTLCALTVDKNPNQYNLGIGFKPGTNDLGYFAFGASTRVPFDVLQEPVQSDQNHVCADAINPNRMAQGFVSLPLEFRAPMDEGEYRTVIVVESTDPDEPVVEIPIVAHARNSPVAVAKLREFDPQNPSEPFTDPSTIQPLKRVYFDGRASYDPRNINDPDLITGYEWRIIEYPVGCNPADFSHQGANTPLYNFWLPLAGHYIVGLRVRNADGIQSGDTAESKVEFDAIPGSRIHVQLTWDDGSNDQDLHLFYLAETDTLCSHPWDCYFANKEPVWFSEANFGEGPNPRLDIDDINGLGPENTNIDVPKPGTYRIVVHYWRGTARTRNTVRVFLNGMQVAEYRRELTLEQAWRVADIEWGVEGGGSIIPYPSDPPSEVGDVSSFSTDSCGGGGGGYDDSGW